MTPYILLFILFLVLIGVAVTLRDLDKEAFIIRIVVGNDPYIDLERIVQSMANLASVYSAIPPVLLGASESFEKFGQTWRELEIKMPIPDSVKELGERIENDFDQ